ncbi:MAG TPA: tyrosine-type recombinase/integrase [Pseudolabrys sp.]
MRDYLEACQRALKPKTLIGYKGDLERLWKPLHKMALSAVSRPVIAAHLRVIAKESGPVSANRARGTLSSFFAWAIGEGLCEDDAVNPVIGTNTFDTKPRDRVLSNAELAAIWKAAPDNDYGRIVKLLLLTGQRRDEIGGLRWSEIDTNENLITLTGARTKNGIEHRVPLSGEAMEALQGITPHRDLVFGIGQDGYAGWSKGKTALDAACGVKGWTLHDLRRTAATGMADLGVLPHVIEAVLNHVSGHKAGVAGIYNRSTYANEKRAALDLWAGHLRVIVAQASGANVTRLKRKA